MTSLLVWTVTYLVHSTLLITAVWATSRWVRSASARDTLWKVAFDRAALARIAPVVVSGTLVAPACG